MELDLTVVVVDHVVVAVVVTPTNNICLE